MSPLRALTCLSAFSILLAPSAAPAAEASTDPIPAPNVPAAVTHHTALIGGREIRYTATAGTIVLTDAKDEPAASVFYVAYTADGLGSKSERPITFAYNGGPGGSSALIHMGAFGPRTVVTTNGAATRPAPYRIVDNENSLLGSSDLVFVDAVGTGFSRVVGHATGKDFYGVDEDGKAFTQFIRRYITTNGRWNSPKYLAGESYGTTRSCVLAKMLQDDGIVLTGVTLISSVLDFATLDAQPGDDEPYWLFLPTEAAIAAYHHKVVAPADLPAYLASVRTYARGEYAHALSAVRSNLRVQPGRFEKQLLGDEERTIGRYDGRFSNFDLDPIASSAETDPSSDAVFGAFTAAFNTYVREELGYKTDATYEFLSGAVNGAWNFKRSGSDDANAVNVSNDLQAAMTANPYLRVFSANGIYDLATPFFATEYSLAHLGLPPELQSHISFGYYPAGHMIYVNPVAHAALVHDLTAFYHTGA
jgi:carboxypeptidase C (cathepsin A)